MCENPHQRGQCCTSAHPQLSPEETTALMEEGSPLIAGGQGRSAGDVSSTGAALAYLCLAAMAAAALAVGILWPWVGGVELVIAAAIAIDLSRPSAPGHASPKPASQDKSFEVVG